MNKFDINDFRQIHKHRHIKTTSKQTSELNCAAMPAQTSRNESDTAANADPNTAEKSHANEEKETVVLNMAQQEELLLKSENARQQQ